MKRCLLALIFALLACALGGCRFAVIEAGETRIGSLFSAAAEDLIGPGSRDQSDDDRVSGLQQKLFDLGYLDRVDGIFGENTQSALKSFQRDWGIDVTGVLDEQTETALYAEIPTLEEAKEATEVMLSGVGGSLEAVQSRLRIYGFLSGKPEEDYTNQTRAAVAAFQRYCATNYGSEFDAQPLKEAELAVSRPLGADPTPEAENLPRETPAPAAASDYPVDGIPTEKLYYYLFSDRFPVYRETVQAGDIGAEVLRVQRRLYSLGYLFDAPDGEYGELTREAVRVFQRRNGILTSGVADERTQLRLFDTAPVLLETVDRPYYIKVSIDDQRVYVYRWVDGGYDFLIKSMICSTGIGNSTPKGVFVSAGHRDVRWHHFADFNSWAQYPFVIEGSILFHSVLYTRPNDNAVDRRTVRSLGRKASHGCVRLMPEDAKWIYDNCYRGQVIEIY